ncbi:MAG: WxL domain-containing protein [Chloroflexota bacterium]|nr:WxL domain-containing protein [Chloroflexota bacterium]
MFTRRSIWLISGIVMFILAAGLYMGNPTPARAAGATNGGDGSSSVNVTFGILPGPLTATMNSIALVGETPNGAYTTTTYQLHMSVSDETGSGNGWKLALAGTLPSSTAILTHVNAACASNSTCSLPQNSVAYPIMMQGNDGVPTNILNAGANSGMGTIDITVTVAVTTSTSVNASTPVLSLMINSGTV